MPELASLGEFPGRPDLRQDAGLGIVPTIIKPKELNFPKKIEAEIAEAVREGYTIHPPHDH